MHGRLIVAVILVGLCVSCTSTQPPTQAGQQSLLDTTTSSQTQSVSFDPSKLGSVERNIVYCTVEGVELKMDVYYPASMSGTWPVIVYVHGGAWTRGSKNEGAGLSDQKTLNAAGFLYVSVDYRLAPAYQFPAMIEDVKCAVRHLRANSLMYNLDPDRVGALGGSAGGHLVSLLGVTDASAGWDTGQYLEQSSRVQAVVDYFGPADLSDESINSAADSQSIMEVFGAASRSDPLMAAASPVSYITQDDPPFLIVQGEEDTVVLPVQSRIFYERLKAAGVQVELVMVQNAGHGFAPSEKAIYPSRQKISDIVTEFFFQELQ